MARLEWNPSLVFIGYSKAVTAGQTAATDFRTTPAINMWKLEMSGDKGNSAYP
jgi:hypothetical protein